MNKLGSKSFKSKFIPAALGLVFCLLAYNAPAQFQQWWDNNGTSVATSGTWDITTTNWANSATLTSPTVPFTNNNYAIFAAGSSTISALTINVPGAVTCEGLGDATTDVGVASGAPVTALTFSGAGSINLPTGTWSFECGVSGNTIYINVPINGTGGIVQHNSGVLDLYGNNGYQGGTTTTGGQQIYYNNGNSFGSGTITITSGSGSFLTTNASVVTLPNAFTINNGGSVVNFGSGNTICSGPWTLQSTLQLKNNSAANPLTISGAISGAFGVQLQNNNAVINSGNGRITFSGANTYTGQTQIGQGAVGGATTLSVASINSVTTPAQQSSSSLGVPSSAANGVITFGNSGSGTYNNALIYTGSGETSDRGLSFIGTTGGIWIEMDGTTGPLVLTGPITITQNGARTLTLQGTSTANNTISGAIPDSGSGATTLAKSQAGTWVLSGANTYTGTTTVNAGTLVISGSIKNGVTTISAGTLVLSGTLGSGGVTINGAGTLAMGSDAGAGTGTININAANDTIQSFDSNTRALANPITLGQNANFGTPTTGNLVFNGAVNSGGAAKTLTINNTTTTFNGVISGNGAVTMTKAGPGTLVFGGANSYNKATAITAGTLALVPGGSISSSSSIAISAGATFDVSALSSPYTLSSSTSLSASGAATPATINGASGGIVDLGSQPINLTYSSSGYALTIAQGALNLNGNLITVTTASALGAGTYNLIQVAGGTITGAPSLGVAVTGSGLAAGCYAYSTVGGGVVSMVVATRGGPDTWNGNNYLTDQNWSDGQNWVSTSPPNLSGDDVIFAGTQGTSPVMDNSYTVYSLTFNSTAGLFTLGASGANVLTVGSGVTNSSTSLQTLNLPVQLHPFGSPGASQWNVTGGPITANGAISDTGGGVGLALSGANTLSLGTVNTYTGPTTIAAGSTLAVTSAGQLQSGSYAAAIADSGTFTYASSAAQTLSGIVSGTGALTVNNAAANLTLTAVETYTGATTITAGTLTIGGAGSLLAAGNITDNGALVFNSSAAPTMTGIISGTGTLTQNGPGQVYLQGVNTYSGNTTVGNGILQITNDFNLGTAPGGPVANSIVLDQNLGWNSGTGANANNYYLRLQAGNTTLSLNRGVYLGNTAGYGGGMGAQTGFTLTVNGPITGPGGLWLGGGTANAAVGTVALTNTANSYSGGTYIVGGTLTLGANSVLPSGTSLTLSDAGAACTFDMNGKNQTIGPLTGFTSATPPVIKLTGALDIIESTSTTFNGVISSAGGSLTLDATSTGTLTLTGVNTYTGPTTINAGTLTIGTGGKLNSGSYAGAITDNGTFNFNSAVSQTLSGTISGSGSLSVNPSLAAGCILTLSGAANSYSGPTTIANNGQISISLDANLGTPPVSLDPSHLTLNYGFLHVTGTGTTLSQYRGITLGSGQSFAGQQLAGVIFADQMLIIAGPIAGTLGGGFMSGGGTATIGPGTNELTAACTYNGPTAISTGRLLLGAGGSLPYGTSLAMASDNYGGAIFDLGGFSQTIGPLVSTNAFSGAAGTGTPTILLASSAALTVLETNLSTTFGGKIIGSGSLIVIGDGSHTLTLSNANNTYSGGTTITNGTLALTGVGTVGSGTLTVANGATFDVSGLNSTLTLGASQTLSGPTAAGTATIKAGGSAGLTMGGSGLLSLPYYVPNTAAINVTGGALTLQAGNSVTVYNTGSALAVGSYLLISKGGSGSVAFASTAPTSVTVTGNGKAANTTASLQIASGQLYLNIACNAPTTANAGSPQEQCETSTATLAGNTPTVGTGTWTLVSGNGTITTPSSPTSGVTDLGYGANTFQWTIHNPSCTDNSLDSSSTVTITRDQTPSSTITAADSSCANSATNTASAPTQAGVSYTWTISNGTITAGGTAAAITYTSGASGSVGLTCGVTNATTQCGSSSSASVPIVVCCVAPAITGGIDPGSTNLCVGSPVVLTLTNISGTALLSYQWLSNNVDIVNATNASYTNLSVAVTDAGSYVCVVTNGCGSVTSVVAVVTVNATSADPTSATAGASPICNGGSTTLTLNGGGGGANETIQWYTGSCVGGTSVGSGNNLSVSPATTTTYYGRYEDGAPCSYNSACAQVTVTVNQESADPTSATASSTVICIGGSTTLTLNGGGGGTGETIQWYTGSCVGGTSVGSGNNLSVSPATTTTYYGRYEDGAPCNYQSACAQVTVTNVPPPAILSITNSGTGVVLVWASVAGANYQVQYTTDLSPPVTWTPLGSQVNATGSTATYTDTSAIATQRFYQISVVCP